MYNWAAFLAKISVAEKKKTAVCFDLQGLSSAVEINSLSSETRVCLASDVILFPQQVLYSLFFHNAILPSFYLTPFFLLSIFFSFV